MSDPERVPTQELGANVKYRQHFGGLAIFFLLFFWGWHFLMFMSLASAIVNATGHAGGAATLAGIMLAVRVLVEIWAYGAIIFGSMVLLSGTGFRRPA